MSTVQRVVLAALSEVSLTLDDLCNRLERTSRYTRMTVRGAVQELVDSGDVWREGNLLTSLEPR